MSGKKCGASTRAGGSCSQPAGYGTEHQGYGTCKWHGGNSPSHKVKAQRQMVADSARTLGLPIEVDPAQAIVAELARGFGSIHWLQEQIAAVPADELTQPLPRELLHQLNVERDRSARVAAEALRLGLEAKALAVTTRQGEKMANILRVVPAAPELGLSAQRQRLALMLIAQHMLDPAADLAVAAEEAQAQMVRELAPPKPIVVQQVVESPPPPPTPSPKAQAYRPPCEPASQVDEDGVKVLYLSNFGARRAGFRPGG